MTNEIRSPSDEMTATRSERLGLRASSFLRHSSFVLRHSSSYQLDFLAFLQSHDRFFPMRTSPKRAAHPFLFAGVIAGVYIDNLLLKQTLDRLPDLNLVSARVYSKNIFVLFFAHQRRLFR